MMTDLSQQKVIEVQGGEHLVLAPPGCGKTHILTERIRYAHERGVEYSDMLCLTFTNRAARSMRERIAERINDDAVNDIYVGNVHRFCSRFLFDYALIPAVTSIIDDDDSLSIMARFMGEEEDVVAANSRRRTQCFHAVHLAAFMYQIEHCHPKELRLHPDCLSKDDIYALRTICGVERKTFDADMMKHVFHHSRDYVDRIKSTDYLASDQPSLIAMLRKMELAHHYSEYKKENLLVDFEDLLLLTYDALRAEKPLAVANGDAADAENAVAYRHYPWCQVDEVQDLNPLQLEIVDLLVGKQHTETPETSAEYACDDTGNANSEPQNHRSAPHTIMFLGDEQQAIFSFMGAKMSTLEQLKHRCNGNIHHLTVNHRSPDYLLEVYNTYASKVLNINTDLLPSTSYSPKRTGNELSIMCSNTLDGEFFDVAQQAQRLAKHYPDDTTAVIVTSNSDANLLSKRMKEMGVNHFKVSGTDMFSLPEMKLLLAHLSVFANEHNFIAWARLLKGLHIYEQNAAARAFVRQLADRSLLPTDLMLRPDSSYIMQFAEAYENREIVVFDTETTGLNTHEDDILQIAAVKMRGGNIVPGSDFCVFMHTYRPIPAMLGDIVNPIIEERKRHKLLAPAEALQLFVDYIGDAVLLGHNADYDYTILDANLKRYLPHADLRKEHPVYFDSLKLARLLEPQLHRYKLKYLLEVLGLEGENSHLADADVAATCHLVRHCYGRATTVIPTQREFLAQRTTRERAADMQRKMLPLYNATLSRQAKKQTADGEALIVDELRRFYSYLVRERLMHEIDGFEYALRYISREMIDREADFDLHSQIANHVLELSTLKESDLCSADIVDAKVFVTTVHKAKGLEFDNVIVFDAADDRYPSFFTQNDPRQVAEDARKFYVALTRAKKRILVALSGMKFDYHNRPIARGITRFMMPLETLFTTYHVDEE